MLMLKEISVYLMSLFYVNIGIKHFLEPDWFMPIMPPYLPLHLELIYISGGLEVLLGLMLIFKKTRFLAAWGLILLLIAVYPANIYLAFNTDVQQQMNISHFLASWVRLPLQFIFIGIAYWHSKADKIQNKNTGKVDVQKKGQKNNKETKKIQLSWIPEVPGYQAQNEVVVEIEESKEQ